MSLSLYDLTVPILVRNLEILKEILQKGEQWAKDNGKSESELLEARIIDDMNVWSSFHFTLSLLTMNISL